MPELDLLFPLDRVHPPGELPAIQAIVGEAMPQPYRQLLVHASDMTPTLATFHGAPIGLQVLRWTHDEEAATLLREVVLTAGADGPIVEFGAILIHLSRFAPAARAAILEQKEPLGALLAAHAVPHLSCPQAFVAVTATPFLNGVLGVAPGERTLYGRRNILTTPTGAILADILEILPPHPRPK